METFVKYLISLNFLLLLQAVYYRLFLARQRRFQWNRIYLLGGMAVAMLLPLVQWRVVPPSLPSPNLIATLPDIVIGTTAPASLVTAATPEIAGPAWSSWELGLALYWIGVVIALGALAWRNLVVIRLISMGQKTRHHGYTLVATTYDIGPSSYFRFIFWNVASELDAQSAAVAMAHERCHGRQLHSLDLLAVELMKTLCWINPAVYMLRNDLRQTHEYLADQAALQVAGASGIKRLLLAQQLGARRPSIVNSFYSHLKARIMVLTENSKKKAVLQYVCILPLAALMAACTSLAHPAEGQPSAYSVDSPATARLAADSIYVGAASQQPSQFFDLDDMLIRNQLPPVSGERNAKGIVCLGRQPQVLNLDTIMPDKEQIINESQPKLLNRDRIVKLIGYPEEAQKQKIKGKVVVKILVDETGHVARYQFLGENHALLRDAVQLHVKELLFQPGLEAGKPSEWWVIMPFSFGMPGC